MSASLVLLQDPFQVISDFLESPILRISGQLVALLFVVLWLALVYWTYTDATRRGSIRLLWGLVAVIFPYVGTLVYLIVRPPSTSTNPASASSRRRCWSASSGPASCSAPTAATWSRGTT